MMRQLKDSQPLVPQTVNIVGVAPPHEEPVRETLYRGVPRQEEGVVVGAMHEELERVTLQEEVPEQTEGVGVATPT